MPPISEHTLRKFVVWLRKKYNLTIKELRTTIEINAYLVDFFESERIIIEPFTNKYGWDCMVNYEDIEYHNKDRNKVISEAILFADEKFKIDY